MLANKSEFKILDLRSKEAGILNVEIVPCNAQGKPIDAKDGVMIKDPQKDLLNKNISFLFKINGISKLNTIFEVILNWKYCSGIFILSEFKV